MDISTTSSDSSVLSLKRIKNYFNMNDSDADDSVLEDMPSTPQTMSTPRAKPDTTENPDSDLAETEDIGGAGSAPSKDHNGESSASRTNDDGQRKRDSSTMEVMLDRLLTTRLNQVKCDMVREITGAIGEEIEELKGRVFELECKNESLENRVKKLELNNHVNDSKIAVDAEVRSVANDMYARRSSMVIFGLEEERNENATSVVVKMIKDKLKIQIKDKDIEVCHRLGKTVLNKKRPMIVKFRYRDTKWDVMTARRGLKGTNITFSESLCKEVQRLLKEVKAHENTESVWAWNGKIFAKDKKGDIHTIHYGSDWQKLLKPALQSANSTSN